MGCDEPRPVYVCVRVCVCCLCLAASEEERWSTDERRCMIQGLGRVDPRQCTMPTFPPHICSGFRIMWACSSTG